MIEHRVDLGAVGRALQALLAQGGCPVAMLNRTSGEAAAVTPELATAADGLLPVFLVAADAVWRDATGKSFGVELRRDPQTLLGFRAEGVSGGPFSSLMLSMMEAIAQIARPGMILVNDFDVLWRSIERGAALDCGPSGRAAPSPGAR